MIGDAAADAVRLIGDLRFEDAVVAPSSASGGSDTMVGLRALAEALGGDVAAAQALVHELPADAALSRRVTDVLKRRPALEAITALDHEDVRGRVALLCGAVVLATPAERSATNDDVTTTGLLLARLSNGLAAVGVAPRWRPVFGRTARRLAGMLNDLAPSSDANTDALVVPTLTERAHAPAAASLDAVLFSASASWRDLGTFVPLVTPHLIGVLGEPL